MLHRGTSIRLTVIVATASVSIWACGRTDADPSESADRTGGGANAAGGMKGETGGAPPVGGAMDRQDSGGTASLAGGTVSTSVGGETNTGGTTNCQTPELAACEPDSFENGFVFFNASTGVCEGSAGQCLVAEGDRSLVFESLALCLSMCPNAHPEAQACDNDDECELSFGCCEPCLPIDLVSVHAFNVRVGPPDCLPIQCPACAERSEADDNRQYFLTRCTAHSCEVYDFTRSIGPNCDGNGDCVLRDGRECCQDCDGESWVPISYSGPFPWGNCDDVVCPTCDQPAIGVGAVCEAGYCAKVPWAP